MKTSRSLALAAALGLAATGLAPTRAQAPKKPAPPALVVQGKVKAATRPPRPGSVPYKDAVIAVHLTQAKAVRGKLPGKDLLVYVWGMRANKLTPAATYKAGQTLTLSLQPWEKAEDKYGGYNRRDFEDDAVLALPTYWGEAAK